MKRIALAVAALLVAGALLWHPPARPAITVAASPTPVPAAGRRIHRPQRAASAIAVVYIVGAIARPGLYRVAADARVDDAVRSAGGFASDADAAGVNLAAHVADGDEIVVPVRGAPISAPRAKRTRGKRAVKTTRIIDVNAASAADFAQVPGIGPTLAARIVAVRTRDGNFTSLDQLLDVAGMTQTRLDRAQEYLRLAF